MDNVQPDKYPHFCSQVLTGLIFDIILRLFQSYQGERGHSPAQAAWYMTRRVSLLALQPLDYLPPWT